MQLTKLVYVLPLFTAVLAVAVPEAEPGTRVTSNKLSALDKRGGEVEKRQCNPNGCKCANGAAGVYCGWCAGVLNPGTGGSWSDVFQCNGSGGCCRYGPRDSCASWQSFSPCG
ncbi:hypothetical protein H072_2379 [Dactylellina haptotyla CBS 200.50]|uniref:Uncharacterized protein n=1 Tax=Dactylellina haptotyla (strain CBS 200.50) TaxID=1284197 RepID=S8AKX2_DACHA|nr:hypothetical protein H072_2379 [Dactylellina haptotyla CBS 200.50]